MVEFLIDDPWTIISAISVAIVAIFVIISHFDKKKHSVDFLYFIRDPYKVLGLRLARGDIDKDEYNQLKKILDECKK